MEMHIVHESLQAAVQERIKTMGGLRSLSRATRISPSYLCRIAKGENISPSEEILAKLGLERRVTYRDAK